MWHQGYLELQNSDLCARVGANKLAEKSVFIFWSCENFCDNPNHFSWKKRNPKDAQPTLPAPPPPPAFTCVKEGTFPDPQSDKNYYRCVRKNGELIQEPVYTCAHGYFFKQTCSPETQTPTLQWGVERTRVKALWDANFTGQGVIVGHIDSGVRHTHVILRDNWLGNVSPHGWFDPRLHSETPYASGSHGTHTLGSAVGANGYGVSPGSLWSSCIACYGSDGCPEVSLKMCGEFMLCPTDPQGGNKDCSKAPQLVTNSWGGGQALRFYDSVIAAWRAADIIPIFAAGNDGPDCRTISSPGDHEDVITVGAIQQNVDDPLAPFSSVGPQIR